MNWFVNRGRDCAIKRYQNKQKLIYQRKVKCCPHLTTKLSKILHTSRELFDTYICQRRSLGKFHMWQNSTCSTDIAEP